MNLQSKLFFHVLTLRECLMAFGSISCTSRFKSNVLHTDLADAYPRAVQGNGVLTMLEGRC